jgi:hypothetical protein
VVTFLRGEDLHDVGSVGQPGGAEIIGVAHDLAVSARSSCHHGRASSIILCSRQAWQPLRSMGIFPQSETSTSGVIWMSNPGYERLISS